MNQVHHSKTTTKKDFQPQHVEPWCYIKCFLLALRSEASSNLSTETRLASSFADFECQKGTWNQQWAKNEQADLEDVGCPSYCLQPTEAHKVEHGDSTSDAQRLCAIHEQRATKQPSSFVTEVKNTIECSPIPCGKWQVGKEKNAKRLTICTWLVNAKTHIEDESPSTW